MTVSHSDMEAALRDLGCRTVHKVKKIVEYMLPGTKEPFYHNADMTRFPSKMHTGNKECHYGWAFEFDSTMAVGSFIKGLLSVVKGSS